MEWLLLIIPGGIAVPTAVFFIARAIVYRQSEPWRGREYLEWFRAQKAAEHDEAVRAELAKHLPAPRPAPTRRQRELTL